MWNKKHTFTRFLLITAIISLNVSVTAMELKQKHQRTATPIIAPEQTFSIFNPNKALKKGLPLDSFCYINTCITPNQKSIIISRGGEVSKYDITSHFGAQHAGTWLFKHPSVQLSTLLTTDETKDGSLLIVSGGNYYNKKQDKWTSEIISYHNKSFTIKTLDWPLQALKLSNKGNLLVAATPSAITLYNFNKGTEAATGFEHFHGCYANPASKRIIDVDIADSYVIAAGKYGMVQLMSINKEQTGLSLLAKHQIDDDVKRMTLITARSILYTTHHSETKIIDMFDCLNREKKLTTTKFAHFTQYEQVALDRYSQTIAYWTKNETRSSAEKSTILICRVTNPKHDRWDSQEEKTEPHKEYYELHASFSENTYNFIATEGIQEEHSSHFLTVNLCKSTIIAVASTGQLFIWKLPSLPSANADLDQEERTEPSDKPIQEMLTVSDASEYSHETTTTTTPHTDKKKSPRSMTLLTSLATRPRSNSTSPKNSQSTSPRNSPKKQKSSFHESDGR